MDSLDADAAAIHAPAQRDDIAQLHALRGKQRRRVELAIHVGFTEPVESGVEVRRRNVVNGPMRKTLPISRNVVRLSQRVQLGGFVATDAVRRNQFYDGGFLLVGKLSAAAHDGRQAAQVAEFFLDGQVAGFTLGVGAQGGKGLRPVRRHALLVIEPVFVQRLDPGGIVAEQVGRIVKLFQGPLGHENRFLAREKRGAL